MKIDCWWQKEDSEASQQLWQKRWKLRFLGGTNWIRFEASVVPKLHSRISCLADRRHDWLPRGSKEDAGRRDDDDACTRPNCLLSSPGFTSRGRERFDGQNARLQGKLYILNLIQYGKVAPFTPVLSMLSMIQKLQQTTQTTCKILNACHVRLPHCFHHC